MCHTCKMGNIEAQGHSIGTQDLGGRIWLNIKKVKNIKCFLF